MRCQGVLSAYVDSCDVCVAFVKNTAKLARDLGASTLAELFYADCNKRES